MSDDSHLKKHVEEELRWEPSVNEAAIGVSVKDAVVTLTGHVRSFSEKDAAERAVLRIRGVRAVVSELGVSLLGPHERTDEDIARAASDALQWNATLPKDAVRIKVSKGIVTLSGTLEWQYQREMANRAVSGLIGVKGVVNQIQVKSSRKPTSAEVKSGIEAALKRSAEVEARRIQVEIHESTAVLTGTVDSWSERRAAERAAWAAPGVSNVKNNIYVGIVTSTTH